VDYREKILKYTHAKFLRLWVDSRNGPMFSKPYEDMLEKHKGYIYLFHISGTNIYKIGLSIYPDSRLVDVKREYKNFIAEHGTELVKVCSFPTNFMKQAEYDMHARYESKSIGNEWFELTPEDVEDIKAIPGIFYNLGDEYP
jgi:hypothetical protein